MDSQIRCGEDRQDCLLGLLSRDQDSLGFKNTPQQIKD